MKSWTNGLLCVFLLLNLTNTAKSDSRYFADFGRNAIGQEVQDLKNSSVILMIAFAPGMEDLPAIAYYRLGRGATVAVAYITNGEDLPENGNDDSFYQLAGKRKEEAYQATSSIGASAYFLNVPEGEISAQQNPFHPSPGLVNFFRAKIDTVVDRVKPDVVVLQRDPFSLDDTPRFLFFKEALKEMLTDSRERSQWKVKSFFTQSRTGARTLHIPVGQKNVIWAKTYAGIGKEAQGYYGSLTSILPLWEKSGNHDYQLIFPAVPKRVTELDGGLFLLDKKLQAALPSLQQAISFTPKYDREKKLADIADAIGHIDELIRDSKSLDKRGLRVVTKWKLGLEQLRCSVLGVKIGSAVSDSIVTRAQLFFFTIEIDTTQFSHDDAKILFPGVVDKEWFANEKQNTFYPLSGTNKFRIMTPRNIPNTSPETSEGFNALQVRAPFTFLIIVHHTSGPASHNFLFRKEIPLTIAPLRSVVTLTPTLVAHRDSILRVRFKNNTHDSIVGTIYINDPFITSPRRTVRLLSKNAVLLDTFSLQWKDTTFSGIRQASLQTGTTARFGGFDFRSLDVKTDISGNIGFFSMADHPILQSALMRLGVAPYKCDTTADLGGILLSLSTLVIDEGSLRSFAGSPQKESTLRDWVSAGGRVIVFPDYGFDDRSAAFGFLPVVTDAKRMALDSTDRLFQFPNRINGDDFQGSSIPLSFGGLRFRDHENVRVPLRAKTGDQALLAVKSVGKGEIVYVALNMDAQFLGMQNWAYKLLANFLSSSKGMN